MTSGSTEPPARAGGSDDEQAGENTCPTCASSGRRYDAPCSTCDGTGVVVEVVGDA